MNINETRDEFFFEYFANRPTWFTVYLILTIIICTFGVFLNFVIIFVKFKRSLNGFDILTINMALTQIFVALASVFFLVDEIHYKLTQHSWCWMKFHSYTFSTTTMGYSCFMTLIVSLCATTNIKNIYAIIAVIFVWILGTLIAYPYVDVILFEVYTNGTKSICVLRFETIEEVKIHRTILTIFEYFLPLTLIMMASIIALIYKREEICKKSFIVYPVILGFYFIISCFYISTVDFNYFFVGIQIKMWLYSVSKLLFSSITIVNAVVYFWIDQNLYSRCLHFLKLDRGKSVISYVNVKNDRDEDDVANVCFDQI